MWPFAVDVMPRPVLELREGEQVVVELPRAPSSASVTDPRIAWVRTSGATLMQGLQHGTTDTLFQFGTQGVLLVDVSVTPDLRLFERTIHDVVDPPAPPALQPLHTPHRNPVPTLDVTVGESFVLDLPFAHCGARCPSIFTARMSDDDFARVGWRGSELVFTAEAAGQAFLVLQDHEPGQGFAWIVPVQIRSP